MTASPFLGFEFRWSAGRRVALSWLCAYVLMLIALAPDCFAAEEAIHQRANAQVVERNSIGDDQFQIRRPNRWQDESRAAVPRANGVPRHPGSNNKSAGALPSPNSIAASPIQDSNQATPAVHTASDSARRYKLASGDALTIKVFNYKDLSGEYLVRYDGSISVPVLGSLQVAGREISDVERLLSERVTKITHAQSYVSVEVSRYRPFYVVGFVDKPGAYPWQPGLSVLHALTLAGGHPRIEAASPILGDREVGELNEKVNLLKRALIRRARLIAERDDEPKIIVHERLRTLASDLELEALMSLEQRSLAERHELMESKRKNLEQAMMHAKEEISSLLEKQKSIKRQIDLQTGLATRLRNAPKGIVQNTRFMEIEISLARFVAEGRDIVKEIAIAKQRLSNAEHKLKTLYIERRIEIDADVNRLDLEIAAYNRTIATSNAILARMGSSVGGGTPALETKVSYVVVRKIGSKATALTVDEFANVLPGDILRVQGSFMALGGNGQKKPNSGIVNRLPLQPQKNANFPLASRALGIR